MKQVSEVFRRYLPPDKDSSKWGWRIIDAGRQFVPPHTTYPPEVHPKIYLFDEAGFRILNEYQIILIINGGGYFISDTQEKTKLTPGSVIILYPGKKHCYFPDKETGWEEYWVGFEGEQASQIMNAFFDSNHQVLNNNNKSADLIVLYDQILSHLQNPFPGSEQIAASILSQLVATARAGNLTNEFKELDRSKMMLIVKSKILESIKDRTNWEQVAASLGLSYSTFRKKFRSETGHSPREFENLIRLNRSCDLLRSGQHNISAIAEMLGYNSVYYFSRAFKKQFGASPKNYKTSK